MSGNTLMDEKLRIPPIGVGSALREGPADDSRTRSLVLDVIRTPSAHT